MTIQAISAQALRPAVNFKKNEAQVEEKTFAPTKKADPKEAAAKVIGGAVALAALGFGVYRFVKARNAQKAKEAFEKYNPPKNTPLYRHLGNAKAVDDANRIVAEHDAMLRRLCDHAPNNVELNAMNWDAQPVKRADFLKELAEKA